MLLKTEKSVVVNFFFLTLNLPPLPLCKQILRFQSMFVSTSLIWYFPFYFSDQLLQTPGNVCSSSTLLICLFVRDCFPLFSLSRFVSFAFYFLLLLLSFQHVVLRFCFQVYSMFCFILSPSSFLFPSFILFPFAYYLHFVLQKYSVSS